MPNRILFASLIPILFAAAGTTAEIKTTADKTTIGMGESIALTTQITSGRSGKRDGYRVIPFVNGRRWGAIEESNDAGVTVHHLPLPNPGTADIQVLVHDPIAPGPRAQWIAGPAVPEISTRYFQRAFAFEGDPAKAKLYVAVDDSADIFLNGVALGETIGWGKTAVYPDLAPHLVSGDNVLSIAVRSTGGLAGLLVRLEADPARDAVVISDGDWTLYTTAPSSWPLRAEEEGQKPTVLSGVEWSPWRQQMSDWPTLDDRSLAMAGTLAPADAPLSEAVQIRVERRDLQRPTPNPAQRVGIQYEPWFTPHNANWGSSHAIPLTGLYWSWNTDVIRQQMIWLIESGVDFLVVDWTNHLWDKAHWGERGDNTNEIIHATTMLLETLAQMRDDGHPVPKVVLYAGLNNGPSTTVTAVNEELAWIHNTYVRNPRFAGLFEQYLDKPLMLVHNGGGPNWVDADGASQVDDSLFTIRYQSSQHEFSDHEAHGFWSWMDSTLEPPLTSVDGTAEALTVSSAFFSTGGWKKEGAYGRRGGWTLVEGFKQAFRHRPRFLQLHQYQEFAGQWEGGGYGPAKDIYVDSYSVEMSDDIEPVSLTADAYRGEGGWGFYYLNLLRALVDCYQQAEPETTVLALDSPGHGKSVAGPVLPLRWTWVGRPPAGFVLEINGKKHDLAADATTFELDLAPLEPGPLEITLTASGTAARYALSHTEASLPAPELQEARVSVTLNHEPAAES